MQESQDAPVNVTLMRGTPNVSRHSTITFHVLINVLATEKVERSLTLLQQGWGKRMRQPQSCAKSQGERLHVCACESVNIHVQINSCSVDQQITVKARCKKIGSPFHTLCAQANGNHCTVLTFDIWKISNSALVLSEYRSSLRP